VLGRLGAASGVVVGLRIGQVVADVPSLGIVLRTVLLLPLVLLVSMGHGLLRSLLLLLLALIMVGRGADEGSALLRSAHRH